MLPIFSDRAFVESFNGFTFFRDYEAMGLM